MARRMAGPAVAFIVLIAGCGGAGDQSPAPVEPTPAEYFVVVLPGERPFVEEPGVSEYVGRILADDVVTFSEYEMAFFEMITCIKAAGATYGQEPWLDVTMRYTYSLRYPPALEEPVRACKVEYFEPVSRAWGKFVRPGLEDLLRNARIAIGECLRSAGGDAESVPSKEDMRTLLAQLDPVFLECLRMAQVEHNLGPTLP